MRWFYARGVLHFEFTGAYAVAAWVAIFILGIAAGTYL